MSHNLTGMVLQGELQKSAVSAWDLLVVDLPWHLKLCYMDHYYSAYWQKRTDTVGRLPQSTGLPAVFPGERVLNAIAKEISRQSHPTYAIIYTDYFGGVGDQYAQMYRGEALVDSSILSINDALREFGVTPNEQRDEFDAVELYKYRSNPEYLSKYIALCDEIGA